MEFFWIGSKMAEEIKFENRHFWNLSLTWPWPWPQKTLKVISPWMSHQP